MDFLDFFSNEHFSFVKLTGDYWSDSDTDDDIASYPGIDDDSDDELVATCAPSRCLFCEQTFSDGEKVCQSDHCTGIC